MNNTVPTLKMFWKTADGRLACRWITHDELEAMLDEENNRSAPLFDSEPPPSPPAPPTFPDDFAARA